MVCFLFFFSLCGMSQSSRVFPTLWRGNLLNLCSPVQRGVISPQISPARDARLVWAQEEGRIWPAPDLS